MTTTPAALHHHDYTIGWISALPLEMAAAAAMLDERHPDLPTKPTDDNTYILGRIHVHNVVIACLPSGVYGTTSAATIASQIRLTFPSIRIGLMVGIGGGVPGTPDDVRLGDVVVSKPTRDYGGIVQYDYGKSLAGGAFARQGVLNKPPPILLTAISRLQAAHFTRPSQISWLVSQAARSSCFAYPGADRDILFDSEYDHVNPENNCTDCDLNRRRKRSIRASQDPQIHYGLIASANQVMKDGRLRDKLARELGILCFEMEAAGLMDSFPCLVVRGICDYSDSHKSKEWQGYAAAVAAAYTKELLSIIHGKQVEDEPSKLSTGNIPYLFGALSPTPRSSQSVSSQRNELDEQEELLEQISSYQHEQVHRRLAHKRLTGTTQWFLENHEFKAWLERRSNKLWCTGKIGSGKTVIAFVLCPFLRGRADTGRLVHL
ncbi:5'-methylthioadenosine/S-adenosylhomocysteine nucleosidase family protein [Aspergillus fijiensis CBS 313.89]|uniref:Purine and uridine phosphorylase n=1 Tax=Aspergillus fijiensis CBS 313.89 TaxID=1448319 RepID=A0A8G1RXW8_9EURO|nr:purine and uridine phosphorylase [Aspergillus fijiensis CBS 313.89]RAK81997.1 purine and uridine phosphorylase [Aspergillus fijiensis CBS 313.89]